MKTNNLYNLLGLMTLMLAFFPMILAQTIPQRLKGEPCASSVECIEDGVFCGPDDGLCGGTRAQCEEDTLSLRFGESDDCVSGFCKGDHKCSSLSQALLGESCVDWYDCEGTNVQCTSGVCGGAGTACTPDNDGDSGTSYECASYYCRDFFCSNPPYNDLGDPCSTDNDCEGYFFDSFAFACGIDGRCGGNRAACQANDLTANGESVYCVSNFCSGGFCSSGIDPSPTPNGAGKRHLSPAQVRQQLCPAGMTPCPVGTKGYECINTMSDIESCGGCPQARDKNGTSKATDCSALSNVDSVTCVDGTCAIESCIENATYCADNNTCILDA